MFTSRFQLTLACLTAFLCGIAIHEYFQAELTLPNNLKLLTALSIVTVLTVLTVLTVIAKKLRIFLQILRILKVFLVFTVFFAGFLRAHSSTHIPSPQTIDYYASEEGNNITVIGTIAAEPDIRRDKVNYTIAAESIKQQSANNKPDLNQNSEDPNSHNNLHSPHRPISGKLLISTGKHPSYQYGDTLEISGQLLKPTSFDSFDYAGYLSRYGIYSVIYRPSIKTLKQQYRSTDFKSDIWDFKQWFFKNMLRVKQRFESQMNKTFSTEPSSSFMAGLLLGSRKGIPDELSEAFRVTGLTHIIAISGYNITLIVTILMALFRPLGRKSSIWLAGFGVVLFTFFVGASPAVVRACIMGLIGLIALNSDRKGDITLTLLLTACLMVGWNPKILFHDVGFQLSFLATMGLIYVAPLIKPLFNWLPDKLAIRESVLLTISAQIMALPIILFNFQNLSIVSPLSNLLIAGPILPLAMLFGFVGTLASFIWLPLAKFIAYPAYLLLAYVTNITWITAKIPYAMLRISWFGTPLFISYFVGLSILLILYWKKDHLRNQTISLEVIRFKQQLLHTVYAY